MRAVLIVGLMAIAGSIDARAGVDTASADYVMPGCRSLIVSTDRQNPFLQGLCSGQISGVWDMAIPAGSVCSPSGADMGQATRVVVQYIDARPARMHDRFSRLALEALRAAWPCTK